MVLGKITKGLGVKEMHGEVRKQISCIETGLVYRICDILDDITLEIRKKNVELLCKNAEMIWK